MSELRNRFDNTKKEDDTTKEVISEVTSDVVDLGDKVTQINDNLNKLVNEEVECNEGLKDMTRSMYLSDNEDETTAETESTTNDVKEETDNTSEEDSDSQGRGDEEDSDDEGEEDEDEGEEDEDEGEEEREDEEGKEDDESEDSEESHKCQVQTRIIFVPVKQREDDGIPGLITGVATLLLCVWAMRALCLICAIGTECYPNRM